MAFDWYYGPGGYKSEDTPYFRRAGATKRRRRGCIGKGGKRAKGCTLVKVKGRKFLCRIVKRGRLACSKVKC